MKKDFYNLDHAQSYLNGTIVRYKNNPVYIRELYRDGGIKAQLSRLTSPKIFSVRLNDDQLDINPFPLGFVNTVRNAQVRGMDLQIQVDVPTCISRNPARRWKIGLDSRALWKWTLQANTDLVVDFPQIRSVLYSKGFEDLAKDQYPSLEEVKEKLFGVEFNYAMAFSRRFALSKNGSLGS